jgi:hypothetical protein
VTCPNLEIAARWLLGDRDAGDWDAGDWDEVAAERFEEHYFSCDLCLARVERLERLIDLVRASVPPILTVERRRELQALYPHMPAVDVQPGNRALIRLGPKAAVGVWVLHAPLGGASRVDLEARDAAGGGLFSFQDVPFDPARGEVVLPCQLHYRALGASAEMHVRVTVTELDGRRPVTDYILDHEFESL